nr:hypothetical protein EP46_00345 [Pantoea sp. 3.5.1]
MTTDCRCGLSELVDFLQLADNPGTDKIFIFPKVQLPTDHVNSVSYYMDMLPVRIIVHDIAAKMGFSESHPGHIIVSECRPLSD